MSCEREVKRSSLSLRIKKDEQLFQKQGVEGSVP